MDQNEEKQQKQQQNWLQKVTGSLYGLTLSERQLRNRRRGRYIFTDKKHPWRGIFSVVMGVFAFLCLVLSILLTFRSKSAASGSYAVGAFLGLAYAVCGLVMGILSGRERDIYAVFPRTGVILNILALLSVCGVVVLGVLFH